VNLSSIAIFKYLVVLQLHEMYTSRGWNGKCVLLERFLWTWCICKVKRVFYICAYV